MGGDDAEVGLAELGLRQAAVEAHRHALAARAQQQHRAALADAHVAVAGGAVGGVGHLVAVLVAHPQLRAFRQLARGQPRHVGVEQVEALRHVALGGALGRVAVAAGGRDGLDAAGGVDAEHGAEGDGHHAVHRRQAAGRQVRRADARQHVADDGGRQQRVGGGVEAPAFHGVSKED
ncbi:hypothetical protein D9M69_469440 [compost metagenome]